MAPSVPLLGCPRLNVAASALRATTVKVGKHVRKDCFCAVPFTLCIALLPAAGGTINPVPCGNVTVYCPSGSSAPQPVQPGYYSDVAATAAIVNTSLMARQVGHALSPPPPWSLQT